LGWTAVALAAALITTPAAAQIRPGAVTLSPLVGGYSFDGDQNLENRAVYGLGVGYDLTRRWGLELMGNYIDTRSDAGRGDAQVSSLRADALFHFRPEKRLVPYLSVGAGGIHFDPDYRSGSTDPLVDLGGGIKYFLSPRVALRGDLRNIDSFNDSAANWCAAGGLTLLFGGEHKPMAPADTDGDGVTDDRDNCPETPPGTTVGVDGCPPSSPVDTDGDGVTDDLDRCPSTPAGAPVDAAGCPKDTDGDGVADYLDRCPRTPHGVAVDVHGCAKDSDGDGVTDHLDRCPNTPAGATVDAAGCPKDTDGDGVADFRDQCPNTPRQATVDGRGCWVLHGVHFATSKADLTRGSAPVLDAVVRVLKANPNLRLEVQGHTDATGSLRFNRRLSEQRAKAVAAYFTAHGVDSGRLTAKGYGPSQPAATNDTAEGRAKNRRVELKPLR